MFLVYVLVEPFVLVEETMAIVEENLVHEHAGKDRTQHLPRRGQIGSHVELPNVCKQPQRGVSMDPQLEQRRKQVSPYRMAMTNINENSVFDTIKLNRMFFSTWGKQVTTVA